MSGKTKIEWATDQWNPVTGCSKVSQGCKHCYAEREWPRLAAPRTKPNIYTGREFTDVRCHPEKLDIPLRWTKPRRIFVNSMSDLFHEDVAENFIWDVFDIIERAPWHIFQILTKRPQRMNDVLARISGARRCQNLWLGVSCEDQATADERIPLLLQTPAAVRWISAEPLLGPISFEGMFANPNDRRDGTNALEELDWIVAGGESGPQARPMHPDWVRAIREQCQAACVPFFFKQWGEWSPPDTDQEYNTIAGRAGHPPAYLVSPDGTVHCTREASGKKAAPMIRVGKKIAGRMLDGRTWDEYPA